MGEAGVHHLAQDGGDEADDEVAQEAQDRGRGERQPGVAQEGAHPGAGVGEDPRGEGVRDGEEARPAPGPAGQAHRGGRAGGACGVARARNGGGGGHGVLSSRSCRRAARAKAQRAAGDKMTPPAPEGAAVDGLRARPGPGSVRPDELHNHGVSIGAGAGGGNGTSAVGPNARRGARSGVRQRGRSGRCCTFDRDPPPEDPRNHAETSRNSTLVKSSHVQSGSLCTWESIDARPVTRENRGIMRKTRDWPAGAPLSDVQYPAISGAPRRVRVPGAAGTDGRGPRPGRRARGRARWRVGTRES